MMDSDLNSSSGEISLDSEPQRRLGTSDYPLECIGMDLDEDSGSSTGSDDSLDLQGVCQTCLTVCQADCCQLLEKYHRWKTPKVIEIAVFFLYLAHGLCIPLTSQYIYENFWHISNRANPNMSLPHHGITEVQYVKDSFHFSCSEPLFNKTKDAYLILEEILHNTAQWDIFMNLARSFPSVFASLAIVAYSDIFGRRFGLSFPVVGIIISTIAYIIINSHGLHAKYLTIASILNGVFGGICAASGTAYAYIADAVSDEQRTFRYSLFACIKFSASGLASLLFSSFLSQCKFTGSLTVITVVFILCLLYILLVLPESNHIGKKKTACDFNPFVLFISSMLAFSVYTTNRRKPRQRVVLGILLTVNFLDACIAYGRTQVLFQFLLAPPFCSSTSQVALVNCLAIVLAVAGPFVSIKTLSKWLPDAGIAALACLISGVGLAIQGLAYNQTLLYTGKTS